MKNTAAKNKDVPDKVKIFQLIKRIENYSHSVWNASQDQKCDRVFAEHQNGFEGKNNQPTHN